MTNKSTPPRHDLNDMPDYYIGSLIYYDEFAEGSMRWVCYDGRRKVYCISRASAEQQARQNCNLATTIEVAMLVQSHHFLTRAWQSLDKAAEQSTIEDRLWLESKAVGVRKLADHISLLITQKKTNTDKL